MKHIVHDDARWFVVKRSQLRAWIEKAHERAEDSEYLTAVRGAVSHVLAGLPVEAPEGAESADENVRERPVDPAAGVGNMFAKAIARICPSVQVAFVLVGEYRLVESSCLKRNIR